MSRSLHTPNLARPYWQFTLLVSAAALALVAATAQAQSYDSPIQSFGPQTLSVAQLRQQVQVASGVTPAISAMTVSPSSNTPADSDNASTSLQDATQSTTPVIHKFFRNSPEVALTYTTLHLNAPVGGCGCFWTSGGTAEVAFPIWRYVAGVAEISGQHASNLPGYAPGTSISLLSGLGGLRLSRPFHTRFTPFAQVLAGGIHGFNSYFPAAPTSITSATSFALAAGGGLDFAIAPHLKLRPVQADYLYTQLPNNSTNQQHNLRLSAGLVLSFGR